ncbi:hypothetical protein HanOQP8_Chr08g0287251 [Helianthus annuus]|nr:hypothetical protein HanOQP8_Chr08g0287251 [Helianthus annuus]
MYAVCGPHLQASTGEEVDQMSAVCKEKRVCFFLYKKIFTHPTHTNTHTDLLSLSLCLPHHRLTQPPSSPLHHRPSPSLSLLPRSLSLPSPTPQTLALNSLSLYKLSLSLQSVTTTAISFSGQPFPADDDDDGVLITDRFRGFDNRLIRGFGGFVYHRWRWWRSGGGGGAGVSEVEVVAVVAGMWWWRWWQGRRGLCGEEVPRRHESLSTW